MWAWSSSIQPAACSNLSARSTMQFPLFPGPLPGVGWTPQTLQPFADKQAYWARAPSRTIHERTRAAEACMVAAAARRGLLWSHEELPASDQQVGAVRRRY